MIYRRANIHGKDLLVLLTTRAFLKGRLAERDTIWWALNLKPEDQIKKQAILDTLNEPSEQHMKDPWRLAWRLIEEYWNSPPYDDDISIEEYNLKTRLDRGDRSGSLVKAITDFIAPKLKIEKLSEIHLKYKPLSKRVTKIEDLFSATLTSGRIREFEHFGLEKLTEASFLFLLAQSLDSAVFNGLEIARRLGWESKYLWQLGQLYRVYFIPERERLHGDYEPDEFHDGIAPAVKLLHTVVSRLVEVDFNLGYLIVQRWKSLDSPVYLRLWAAMARDSRLGSSEELADFLLSINDDYFWDKTNFPEVSEVRARRFSSFTSDARLKLIERLVKGPPRSLWSKQVNSNQVKEFSLHTKALEFYRIHIAGGTFSNEIEDWLKQIILNFPDIAELNSVEGDFYKTTQAHFYTQTPDNRFNLLTGKERLTVLETSLSTERSNWSDTTSSSAAAWISDNLNCLLVLEDFKSVSDIGNTYPNVWESFGWAHTPKIDVNESIGKIPRNISQEAVEVELLLIELKPAVIRKAINGISHWISVWSTYIKDDSQSDRIWNKIWPIAVQATNALQKNDVEPEINAIGKPTNSESMDLDTLNTPAGKLTTLFFMKCPDLSNERKPQLKLKGKLRKIANQISSAPGRAGLIGRHRMIEKINYFIKLDSPWTQINLISPLMDNGVASVPLWRAIARRTQFSNVLEYIGDEALRRVNDDRLSRSTRNSLLFSLILECLISLYEERPPTIDFPRIQQLIRNLDDEIRAHGLQTLKGFVIQKNDNPADTPEKRFRRAVVPFLSNVWPQERSFATPASSKALAALPAAAGGAFIEAVDLIERFLVPFQCWSIHDYGLHGQVEGQSKVAMINTAKKAMALLKLLDLTIGTSETAVVPYDLAKVLEHLQSTSPKITENYIFRRLSTAARRI
jgi:hypothetical protein